jgi:hypothetical protein
MVRSNNRQNGFITWQVGGQQLRKDLIKVREEVELDRLIPEEPMAIILNLGISRMLFHPSFF